MIDRILYEITWIDAYAKTGAYYDEGDDYTPLQCIDVGYLMEENDETLVIAASLSEGGIARHISVFPWEFIIKIEELT
ncbi:MAG: hypothetical protein IH848_02305 [Acidobacteria bacterium]|nr:hypothetical protein [Acidobacteriota bacterium]